MEGWKEVRKDGKPKTMSLRFSSKRRGAISDLGKKHMKHGGLLNKHFFDKFDSRNCIFPLFALQVYGNFKLPKQRKQMYTGN